MHDRNLAWDGCFNVRDMGGMRTMDGRTIRHGALARSDGRRYHRLCPTQHPGGILTTTLHTPIPRATATTSESYGQMTEFPTRCQNRAA
jgi:hypothetical protein